MVLGSNNPFAPSVGSFRVPVTPPSVDPDDGQQVTVCFSADWLPVVVGALQQLTLQASWLGDADTVLEAQNRAQELISMFGSVYGGCTETVCITDLIYDPDDDMIKRTFDGGETYVDTPGADPRHADVFRFPPIVADDPRCQAAANMTRWLSDLIDSVLLTVDAAGTAEGLMAIILPFIIELGPFAILIEVVLGLAFILFGAGATALSAAFTSTTYDTLMCIFYCRADADGQVSADALALINTDIDSQIGGLAATVLHALLFLTGEVGLSNAGATGGAPADCSGCDCGWCKFDDFPAGMQSWAAQNAGFVSGDPWATYSAGIGWLSKLAYDGSQYYVGMQIARTFTESRVTGITVSYLHESTSANYPNGAARDYIDLLISGVWTRVETVDTRFFASSSTPIEMAVSGDWMATAIRVTIYGGLGNPGGGDPGGSATCLSVTYSGLGDEPFSGNDC